MSSSEVSKKLANILQDVRDLETRGFTYQSRICVLRNFTIEGLEPFLKLPLLQSGIQPVLMFGDYDVLHQEFLDSNSSLHQHRPEVIVLSLLLEHFAPESKNLGWKADQTIARLQDLFDLALRSSSSLVGVNTFIPSYYSELGIGTMAGTASIDYGISELNQFIRRYVQEHPGRFFLCDWERFSRQLGEYEAMDYRFFAMNKAPFKKAFLNLYGKEVAKAVLAIKGKFKKCLVLDCDNTLWGGVVGEDGISGIQLDPFSYPGNMFYEFQRSVLNLRERGVILALNSKNNPEDVWQVLESHPSCLLKRSHFVAERINWQDKATNLQELANELNLGLDSFVFVDDNPAECEIVRTLASEVTVLQVPTPLYEYPRLLLKDGLFDTLVISAEDKKRTQMYQAEKGRTLVKENAKSISEYLAGLEMKVVIHLITPDEIPRVAQLTQKTNQFNLTTRRYTEGQMSDFRLNPSWRVFSLSVRDKFGDSGLTGVLMAEKSQRTCRIDTLLMSCRILGRTLENVFVQRCMEKLWQEWQPELWLAEFLPTKKNQQVASFWPTLGFQETENNESGKKYQLPSAMPTLAPTHFIEIQE